MAIPITITITGMTDDRFRAEPSGGPVEAASLRELGDRLRDFLANLEDESTFDLVELARLSRSAADQAPLLELARTPRLPTSGLARTDRGRRSRGRRATSTGFFYALSLNNLRAFIRIQTCFKQFVAYHRKRGMVQESPFSGNTRVLQRGPRSGTRCGRPL
jgi:hypothetical protein